MQLHVTVWLYVFLIFTACVEAYMGKLKPIIQCEPCIAAELDPMMDSWRHELDWENMNGIEEITGSLYVKI